MTDRELKPCPPRTNISKQAFEKLIRELSPSAFQITAAKILLRVNGRESMMKYLDGIKRNDRKGR